MTFFLLFIFIRYSAFYYFIWYITISFTTLFPTSTRYFIQHFTTSFTPFTRHAIQYFPPALHSISYDFIHNCTLSTYILRFHSWFPSPFRFIFYVIHFYIYSPFLLFIPSARRSCMAKSLHKPYISRCYSLGQGLPSWTSRFTDHTFLNNSRGPIWDLHRPRPIPTIPRYIGLSTIPTEKLDEIKRKRKLNERIEI